MLDDLHRQHDVERRAFVGQLFDRARAIGEAGARLVGVAPRRLDIARRRVEAGDVGAQSGERLGEQAAPATDVEDRQAGEQRLVGVGRGGETPGYDAAQPGDAQRIDPMQRAHRAGRVPPVVAERFEARDVGRVDAGVRGGHWAIPRRRNGR